MSALDTDKLELAKLKEKQTNATDAGQQKGWARVATAQEALVQQETEAQLIAALAESTAKSLGDLFLFGQDPPPKKTEIDTAATDLDDAASDINTRQDDIAKQRKVIEDAESTIKALLEDIDKRKKKVKDAQDRVTRLQNEAVTTAKSTAPDAKQKAYAVVAQLQLAKKRLDQAGEAKGSATLIQATEQALKDQNTAQQTIDGHTAAIKAAEDKRRNAQDRLNSAMK